MTARRRRGATLDFLRSARSTPSAALRRGAASFDGPGISIKLSALHPRYGRAQQRRVRDELYPVLQRLAMLARQYDIGLNIDAEEADRLELSLDLLERLCAEPGLAGWNGIGFVVQAYQKRCPFVIDHVIDLARRSGQRLMVRLVKGAYWDSEIKRAQVDGLDGYPVYTRKAFTDIAYLACAKRLLAAPEAVYPQFATHNAHTVAAIYTRWPAPSATWPASTNSSACTAWASRSTNRWSGRSPTASSAGHAASTHRSARTRPCSRTSCAGCSRTAPTRRSSTGSPMRRSRSRRWSRIRC